MGHELMHQVSAETLDTFWLTFGGCCAAVLSADYLEVGIGFLGFALVLIYLISIPATKTSASPARSAGPVPFMVGPTWICSGSPLVGALLAGFAARWRYEPADIVDTIVVEEHAVPAR